MKVNIASGLHAASGSGRSFSSLNTGISIGSVPAEPLGMLVLELAALLEGNSLLAATIAAPMWDILIVPSSSLSTSFVVGSSKTGTWSTWELSATLANQLKIHITPTPTNSVKSKMKMLPSPSTVESHPCKCSWIRLKAPARALLLTLRTKTPRIISSFKASTWTIVQAKQTHQRSHSWGSQTFCSNVSGIQVAADAA